MQFRTICERDFETIARIQSQTRYDGSEYSLLYLSGWQYFAFSTMQIAQTDEAVYLRFAPPQSDGEYRYLPPLCKEDAIARAIDALERYCAECAQPLLIVNLPRAYVDALPVGRYEMQTNRDYDEYLYDPQALCTLSGKKYHAKRNYVNRFMQNYMDGDAPRCRLRAYAAEDRAAVEQLIERWQDTKQFEARYRQSEMQESIFLRRAFELLDGNPTYFADVLECDGKIIGFSYGELTPSGVGIVHIEKADVAYEGAYAALNMLFARKHFASARVINRQEDMGLEGLRRSKSSYHPIGFSEKYYLRAGADR